MVSNSAPAAAMIATAASPSEAKQRGRGHCFVLAFISLEKINIMLVTTNHTTQRQQPSCTSDPSNYNTHVHHSEGAAVKFINQKLNLLIYRSNLQICKLVQHLSKAKHNQTLLQTITANKTTLNCRTSAGLCPLSSSTYCHCRPSFTSPSVAVMAGRKPCPALQQERLSHQWPPAAELVPTWGDRCWTHNHHRRTAVWCQWPSHTPRRISATAMPAAETTGSTHCWQA